MCDKSVEDRGVLRKVKEFFGGALVGRMHQGGGGGRCEAEPTESGGRTCREERVVGAGMRARQRAPHVGGKKDRYRGRASSLRAEGAQQQVGVGADRQARWGRGKGQSALAHKRGWERSGTAQPRLLAVRAPTPT